MPVADSIHALPVPVTLPESFDVPLPVYDEADTLISTVIVDSIAADTIAGRVPHFVPVELADSLQAEALADSLGAHTTMPEIPSGLREGIAPEAINAHYSHSTPLIALMTGILILLGLNADGVRRALTAYSHQLWGVRRRNNAFDDEHSVPVIPAVLLVLAGIVFGGIILYNIPDGPVAPTFGGVAISMGVAAVYYAFQFCAYSTTGYAFAGTDQRRMWTGGFLASQAFAGLLMAPEAILLVFWPEMHFLLVTVAISVYCVAKILFIARSFRIFFDKITALLYFILYLCTLEIIPIIALYSVCVYLQGIAA